MREELCLLACSTSAIFITVRCLHLNLKESSHSHLYFSDETAPTEKSISSPGTSPGASAGDGRGDARCSSQAAQAQRRFLNHDESNRRDRWRQHRVFVSVLPE